jgi:hypothetical protein
VTISALVSRHLQGSLARRFCRSTARRAAWETAPAVLGEMGGMKIHHMIIIKPWDTVYLLYNQYWLVLVVDIPL